MNYFEEKAGALLNKTLQSVTEKGKLKDLFLDLG
jgi:hypothetical protein